MFKKYRKCYPFLVFIVTLQTSTASVGMIEKIKSYRGVAEDVLYGVGIANKTWLGAIGLLHGAHILNDQLSDQTHTVNPFALSMGLGSFLSGLYFARWALRDFTKAIAVYAPHQSPEEAEIFQRIKLRPLVYPFIGLCGCVFVKGYLGWEASNAMNMLNVMTGSLVIADYIRKKEFLNRKLCHAITTNNEKEVTTCLEYGADINQRCGCCVHRFVWQGQEFKEPIPMVVQGEIHNKPEILALALKNGLNLDIQWKGKRISLLHKTQNPAAAKVLLEHGVNINILNKHQETPLLSNLRRLGHFTNTYDMIFFLCNYHAIKLDKKTSYIHALLARDYNNIFFKKNIKSYLYCMNLFIEKGADLTYYPSGLTHYSNGQGKSPLESVLCDAMYPLLDNTLLDNMLLDVINKPIDMVSSETNYAPYVQHYNIFLLMHAAIQQKKPLSDLLSPLMLEIIQQSDLGITGFVCQCMNDNANALESLYQVVNKITKELQYAQLKNKLKNKRKNVPQFLHNRQIFGKRLLLANT